MMISDHYLPFRSLPLRFPILSCMLLIKVTLSLISQPFYPHAQRHFCLPSCPSASTSPSFDCSTMTTRHHSTPTPEHPQRQYSATMQLYACSSQLDTAFSRFARFGDTAPWCLFGCDALGTAHHTFVSCPVFDHLHYTAKADVVRETSEQLQAVETTIATTARPQTFLMRCRLG
ncbi:hypothetical protein K466DRAFT_123654 [Polyporus arcularius HHB13444]|uniref:Uncharacterized protein n=1 Tax=Polyporus arcularius HHB13444 TaxID=1314778 RepID=A0A5C3PDX5_9APHY|nr:hypothetical protein K466DRAFT_123654 [Polyporus arcularius HHB13444]